LGRSQFEASQGKIFHQKSSPVYPQATAIWTGGVAEVVEYLLCKCEALSSNLKPTKEREREREREREKVLS
jgi:hypothetical protein